MQHPETIEVFLIAYPDAGKVIINKDDFDEKLHQLDEVKPAPKKAVRHAKEQ